MTRWMARKARCPAAASAIGWQMNYPYAMIWFGVMEVFGRGTGDTCLPDLVYLWQTQAIHVSFGRLAGIAWHSTRLRSTAMFHGPLGHGAGAERVQPVCHRMAGEPAISELNLAIHRRSTRQARRHDVQNTKIHSTANSPPLNTGSKPCGACPMKYANAISPDRTKAATRVNRPINSKAPPVTSMMPATPVSGDNPEDAQQNRRPGSKSSFDLGHHDDSLAVLGLHGHDSSLAHQGATPAHPI